MQESMNTMMETQSEIQLTLNPIADNHTGGGVTVFIAGLTLGVLLGLFIASYLVKLGKTNQKQKGMELPNHESANIALQQK